MFESVILYNRSNHFGIAKDVAQMEEALKDFKIRRADPLEPPVPCDMAIHLEVPIYGWMPWAARNVLVVNPEWFIADWAPYMPRFDMVIYKDPYSAKEAIEAGYVTEKQVRILPWGCKAPPTISSKKTGNKNNGFVWFLGASVSKRAYVPTLVGAWKESYPPLRIYSVAPVDCSGVKIPSNVRFEVQDLDGARRQALSEFFRGHIACSAAEGFSFVAAEAEWAGAFTILNDLNCFRGDYKGNPGVEMLERGDADALDTAISIFENCDLAAISAKRKARAAVRWEAFLKRCKEVFTECKNISVAPRQTLPPMLKSEDCPPISIVTLLYNRRKFFELACHTMLLTDYPKDKIEWIIVEDSDDPMEGASDRVMAVASKAAPLKVEYVPLRKKTTVAEKRNIGVAKATAEIVLMMDDDDHYPATSFRRRVAWLTQHSWKPKAVVATTIACYDLVKGISAVNVPPMNLPLGQRVSEATLTFYKSWWLERKFPTVVQVGEGEEFITGREQDVLEIPPQQIIVAFSHGKNVSSRRIPSGAEVKPGCFWGFPKEFLMFVHGLAGVKIVEE
jgi:hypothetical protein